MGGNIIKNFQVIASTQPNKWNLQEDRSGEYVGIFFDEYDFEFCYCSETIAGLNDRPGNLLFFASLRKENFRYILSVYKFFRQVQERLEKEDRLHYKKITEFTANKRFEGLKDKFNDVLAKSAHGNLRLARKEGWLTTAPLKLSFKENEFRKKNIILVDDGTSIEDKISLSWLFLKKVKFRIFIPLNISNTHSLSNSFDNWDAFILNHDRHKVFFDAIRLPGLLGTFLAGKEKTIAERNIDYSEHFFCEKRDEQVGKVYGGVTSAEYESEVTEIDKESMQIFDSCTTKFSFSSVCESDSSRSFYSRQIEGMSAFIERAKRLEIQTLRFDGKENTLSLLFDEDNHILLKQQNDADSQSFKIDSHNTNISSELMALAFNLMVELFKYLKRNRINELVINT